jgi:RNA polymerase sigma factor (sigma-70 family)
MHATFAPDPDIERVAYEVSRVLHVPYELRDDIKQICAVEVLKIRQRCEITQKQPRKRYLYLKSYRAAKRFLEGHQQSHDQLLEDPATEQKPECPKRELVRRALKRLGSQDRRLIKLRYWHDLTLEQMAKKVGKPLSTLRDRLKEAEANLKNLIGAQGE